MKHAFHITPADIFLILAGKAQFLIDRPGITHRFLNRQAVHILKNDGFLKESAWLYRQIKTFNQGNVWADTNWKNARHYFNPATGKGLWRFRPATEEFALFFSQALRSARDGDQENTAFFLGAAAHLLQDMCVPHHVRPSLFCGHQEYEAWVESRRGEYAVTSGVILLKGDCSEQWMRVNAEPSADMFSLVKKGASETDYEQATALLFPMAQRTTAGLIERFFAIASDQADLYSWSAA